MRYQNRVGGTSLKTKKNTEENTRVNARENTGHQCRNSVGVNDFCQVLSAIFLIFQPSAIQLKPQQSPLADAAGIANTTIVKPLQKLQTYLAMIEAELDNTKDGRLNSDEELAD